MLPQQEVLSAGKTVSPEAVYAELETVLRSPAFERSERLQRFLRYICDLTLKGESSRINEYLIGSEVFRKGTDYSPSEDSVVRRQAHTLRQKLQEYYAGEGADHAVRIELPIGRYVPVFRRIEPPVREGELPAIPEAEKPRRPAISRIAILIAGAVAIFVAGWLASRFVTQDPPKDSALSPIGPAMHEIWGAWLRADHDVAICFSNPMTSVIKHFPKELPADSLPRRFRASTEETAVFRQSFRLPAEGYIYYTPAINQVKIGEAFAAVGLSTLFARAGVPVSTTQSRFLSWDDLRKGDFVLMGHDEANQWIDLLLKKYPLRLSPTSVKEQRRIINATPQPGEPASYFISYSNDENPQDQEYALISMLPGLTADRQLLLISGLNSQATQIAAEYLTSEQSLAELIKELHRQRPRHEGSWHFQAVLKTEVYDKVPTKALLVTVRVIS